jgi:hypothetical protein
MTEFYDAAWLAWHEWARAWRLALRGLLGRPGLGD